MHIELGEFQSDVCLHDGVFTNDQDIFNLQLYHECTIAQTPQILLT